MEGLSFSIICFAANGRLVLQHYLLCGKWKACPSALSALRQMEGLSFSIYLLCGKWKACPSALPALRRMEGLSFSITCFAANGRLILHYLLCGKWKGYPSSLAVLRQVEGLSFIIFCFAANGRLILHHYLLCGKWKAYPSSLSALRQMEGRFPFAAKQIMKKDKLHLWDTAISVTVIACRPRLKCCIHSEDGLKNIERFNFNALLNAIAQFYHPYFFSFWKPEFCNKCL